MCVCVCVCVCARALINCSNTQSAYRLEKEARRERKTQQPPTTELMGSTKDPWVRKYEGIINNIDDIKAEIRERDLLPPDDPQSSRLTSTIRRKLGILRNEMRSLEAGVENSQDGTATARETERRRDKVSALKMQLEQVNSSVTRSMTSSSRY